MGMQDEETSGGSPVYTNYGLGARGIDRMEQGGNVSYPIYDGHGNMIATLAASGGSYSLGNQRAYGARGDVRQGASSGDPKGRYCASIGHKTDDESGLVYMRARYCEANAGRFLSQDSERIGSNYYSYASNDPVGKVDSGGTDPQDAVDALMYVLQKMFVFAPTYIVFRANCAWVIDELTFIRDGQSDRAQEQWALAQAALLAGNAGAARGFQYSMARSLAYAAVAQLAVYQVQMLQMISAGYFDDGDVPDE